jgi:hypothetical protein
VDGRAVRAAACHADGPGSIARPTISVVKVALFCNPTSGGTFSNTAIKSINSLKFAVTKANVFLAS